MTDNNHPITPPPELIYKWNKEAATAPMADQRYIATQAARWGADQELEMCLDWLDIYLPRYGEWTANFRAARRPKPPSLKEQALALIDKCTDPHGDYLDDKALATIRRALEGLDD